REAGRSGPRQARRGATLVVCPMSLLSQWHENLLAHAGGALTATVYYGQGRDKSGATLLDHDVVITTYGTLASEHSSFAASEAASAESAAQGKPGPFFRAVRKPPLLAARWRRVVLDEAHTIKGRATQQAKAAFALDCECRWAVSGTPVQNALDDLFSLLHFLRLAPFDDYAYWRQNARRRKGDRRFWHVPDALPDTSPTPSLTRASLEVVAAFGLLRGALDPLLLRRTKSTRGADGQPIVALPPRATHIEWLLLSEEERDFYDALRTQSRVRFDAFVAEGRVLNNYATVLHMLLQLRQACDHPYLVLARSGADADISRLGARLLRHECVICLDQFDDPVLTRCSHTFCRDLVTVPGSRFAVDLDSHWKASAKLEALMADVRETLATPLPPPALVIVSQWTSMLDLVQRPLEAAELRFERLDGKLSQPARASVLKRFAARDGPRILLLSLRAGGVGLNLVSAQTLYLLDPWWNPAVEEQAVNRIHRIGQRYPVRIKRFLVQDSVEERILELQKRKAAL
ncbi:hypothetical protein EMIHUDRAFT_51583, partial [Emiliania huxleyi CCMP1516]|uniref:Uncharacterized protein n=2 Tax=Emiliania huxleyi TaxID=2903 RepID=A0A0D3K2L5_EMIH1